MKKKPKIKRQVKIKEKPSIKKEDDFKEYLSDKIEKEKKKSRRAGKQDLFPEYDSTCETIYQDLEEYRDFDKGDIISTGLLGFDNHVLGCGGVARGRIYEIAGENQTGKTLLASTICSGFTREDDMIVYFDPEAKYSKSYAMKYCGINPKKFKLFRPSSGPAILRLAQWFVEDNKCTVIVIDSITALATLAEIEQDVAAHHIAGLARMMSLWFKTIVSIARKNKITIILTNQLREKPSMGMFRGGATKEMDKTTGGKSVAFYAPIRLFLDWVEDYKIDKKNLKGKTKRIPVGHRISVFARKNNLGIPMNSCEYDYYYKTGIDVLGHNIEAGLEKGIVNKSGGWYQYKDIKANGIANFKSSLQSAADTMRDMILEIKNSYND